MCSGNLGKRVPEKFGPCGGAGCGGNIGKGSPERFGRCGGLGGGWVGNLNFARKLPSAPCPILPD